MHISRTSLFGSVRMRASAELSIILALSFQAICRGSVSDDTVHHEIEDELDSHVWKSDDTRNIINRYRRNMDDFCTIDKGISVGLVIDTTGSMSGEISEVKKYAKNLLNELTNAPGNRICDLVFVPTNDETPTHEKYVKTRNLETLNKAVENIRADGGGDCPENTLVGIEKAIDLSYRGSFIFVFTDADPKDSYLYDTVNQKLQNKEITIYFLLTDVCKNEPAESFVKLSRTTSGHLARIDKNPSSLRDIIQGLKDQFQKNTKVIKTITGPSTTGDGESHPVSVPPNTPEMTVIGSGSGIQVELTDPDGSTPKNISKLTDQSSFKIITVSDPAPGVWTIKLQSKSPFKLVASAVSDIDIEFGFSTVPTDDIMSVSKSPGVDMANYLLLHMTDQKKVFNISVVDILVDGIIVESLPVKAVDEDKGLFRAKIHTYPNNAFRMRINAFTLDGYQLTRESVTTIQPQKPGPPAIECKDKMLASAGVAFNMTCTVESQTSVEVRMYKEGSTHTHTDRHLVTTRVSISFLVLRKKDSGHYIIEAKNKAGSVTKKIQLEVIENPPRAFIDMPPYGVKGANITINCRCVSFTDCTVIEWTKSDSPADDYLQKPTVPLLSGENVEVEMVKVMLNPALSKDAGWYICSAKNGGGTSVAKTYLEIRESPEVEIQNSSKASVSLVTFKQSSNVSITCRAKSGVPPPRLSWFRDNRLIVDNENTTIRGNGYVTHTIRYSQKSMEGNYLCRGHNDVGVDEKIVTLQFIKVPKTRKPPAYNSVFLVGTDAILICYFEGIPVPSVTWRRKINDSITIIEDRKGSRVVTHSGQATLTLPYVRFDDTGTYYCEASNVAGSSITQMYLEVEEKPSFEMATDEVTVPLNGTIELPCNPKGIPIPLVSWRKVGGTLAGQIIGKNYRIINAALEEQGLYICRAQNGHGVDEFEVDVKITGLAPPKLFKESKSIIVTRKENPGSNVTLDCLIIQGQPVPTLTWIHRGKTVRNGRPFLISQGYRSLTIDPVSEALTGNYTCVAENQLGKDNKTFTLAMYEAPRIIEQADTIYIRKYEKVELNCTAVGDPMPELTWLRLNRKNEIPTSNHSFVGFAKLRLQKNTVKRRQKYLCHARNKVGVARKVFEVVALIPPKIRVSWEKIITKRRDDIVILNCTASGNPKPTIHWTHDGKKIFTVADNPIYRVTDGSGIYGCTAKNRVGTDDRLTVIERLKPPEIKNLPRVTQAAAGKPIVLNCTVSGNPAPTISWSFNGNEVVGRNHPELEIPRVSKSEEGTYTCIANNSEGFDHAPTRLVVSDKPIINCEQTSYKVKSGKMVTFLCQIEATPQATVRWYKDGRPWGSGLDDGTLQFVAEAKDTGSFTVEAFNTFGNDSETIELTVLSPPTFAASHTKEIYVFVGSKAVLPCQADGFPHPKVIWDVLNLPAPRDRVKYIENTLEVEDVQIDDEGDYKCTAVNEAGSQIHFVHLNIVEKPRVKIVAKNVPKSGGVDTGDDVVLTCDVNGKPTPELKWFKEDQLLSTNRVIRFKASQSKSGNYTCQAKNSIGEASDFISVNAISLPAIHGPPYELVSGIEGHELELFCSASGNPPPSISWFKNDRKLENTSETIINGPTLQILKLSREYFGNITCEASHVRWTFKKTFGIRVSTRPKIVHNPPYEIPIYFNAGFSVPCKAEGLPKPYIEWTIVAGGKSKTLSPRDSYDGFTIHPDGTLLGRNVTWTEARFVSCSASNTADTDVSHHVLRVSKLSHPDAAILRLLERSPSATVVRARRGIREILECPSKPRQDTRDPWLKDFMEIPWIDYMDDRYSLLDDGSKLSVNYPEDISVATYTCVDSRNRRHDFILNVISEPYFLDRAVTEDYKVVENEPLNISCKAKGNPTPMLFWYVKDESFEWISINNYTTESAVFTGNQNENFHINSAITSHTGQYKCVARNQDGDQQRQFSVSVAAIPKLKGEEMVTVEVAIDKPLQLTCQIEGGSDVVYRWFIIRNGRKSRLPTKDKFMKVDKISFGDIASYICTGTSHTGSAQQNFTLKEPLRLREESNSTIRFFSGDDLELECIPEYEVDMINWSKEGEKVVRSKHMYMSMVGNGDILHISGANELDSGTYECSAHNMKGVYKKTFLLQYIDVIPNSKTVINFTLGDRLRLPCPLSNDDPSGKIVWKKDDSDIIRPSLRGFDFYKYDSNKGDEGLYECVLVRKTNNISLIFQVNMLISPKMLQTRTKRAFDLRVGDDLVMECAAEGIPEPTYYWTKNDVEIHEGDDSFHTSSSKGSSNLWKANVSNNDGGRYICHAWSESGKSSALHDVIVVGNSTGDPSGSVTKIHVQLKRPLTITCPFFDQSPERVQWKKGGYTFTKKDMESLGFKESSADGYSTLQTDLADPNHGDVYVCSGETDKTHNFVVNVVLPMHYEEWADWSDCSASCGGGMKKRERVCEASIEFEPENIVTLVHSSCVGQNVQNQSCNLSPCPVDGGWGEWREGTCSRRCGGGGVRKLRRLCDNPAPSSNGKSCQGPSEQDSPCGDGPCHIDGGWSDWTLWNSCSATCGIGTRHRYRSCDRPRPMHGGRTCEGHKYEEQLCHLPACDLEQIEVQPTKRRGGGKMERAKWKWGKWKVVDDCPPGCNKTRTLKIIGTCKGADCTTATKTREMNEKCPQPPECD